VATKPKNKSAEEFPVNSPVTGNGEDTLKSLEATANEALKRLTRFFPKKLLNWILTLKKDLELMSERKRLTVFFSDLAGFTEIMERVPPEQAMNILTEYFTEMVSIAEQYDGTFDKFIGDGMMVFFGSPEEMPEREQCIRAVSMAVTMQRRMKELRKRWTGRGIEHNIRIRMGIHLDEVMVGNFGSRQLMEYTVIGSGVNLANRLESYCEPQRILVSSNVYEYTKTLFPYQEVVEQEFRGFERLVPVSELNPEYIEDLPKVL
jgi:class 3 adenylate cyclase